MSLFTPTSFTSLSVATPILGNTPARQAVALNLPATLSAGRILRSVNQIKAPGGGAALTLCDFADLLAVYPGWEVGDAIEVILSEGNNNNVTAILAGAGTTVYGGGTNPILNSRGGRIALVRTGANSMDAYVCA